MKAGPLISDDAARNLSALDLSTETAPVLPGITLRPLPLARGPLAVLYRGRDRAHRCEVVVKVQRATDDPVAQSRFGREAAVMLRLRHPGIVTLYAFHPGDPEKGDPPALVMEYVPGQTLAALVAEGGRLTPDRAVQIVEEIAAALDCVHAIGIVHRDVKPSNILLPRPSLLPPRRGSAKLTDFGVARIDDDLPLTVMGDVLGTIEYASPEQVHGNGAVDTRSDVYSLAAVSYFALTGTPPFRAADSSTQAQLSVMHRQVFADPPPLRLHHSDIPPALEEAVLRGLAKAPDARYASAGQLAAALRAAVTAAAGEPQQAAMEDSARRTGAVAGALASAVLLLAGFALWRANERTLPAPAPPRLAETKRAIPIKPLAENRPIAAPVPVKPAAKIASAKPLPVAPVKPRRKIVVAAQPPRPHAVTAAPRPIAPKPRLVARAPVHHAPKPVHYAPKAVHAPVLVALRPVSKPPRLQAAPRRAPPAFPAAPRPATAVPLTAASLAPTTVPAVVTSPISPAGGAWYTVSGWIALADPAAARKAELVQASPLWIKVDGQPYPALASGQWAELSAGKHWVTYQPFAGLGVGPKTWAIDLAPSAHLSQRVPLPPAPLPLVPVHLRNP